MPIYKSYRYILLIIPVVYFFVTPFVLAQAPKGYTEYVSVTASAADKYGLDDAAGSNFKYTTVSDMIANIVLTVLGLVGVIFLTLIIWGGISWMTSGGNEQKIDKAKKVIIGATIGLIIIVLGYAITYFIVESLTLGAALPQTSGNCGQTGQPAC